MILSIKNGQGMTIAFVNIVILSGCLTNHNHIDNIVPSGRWSPHINVPQEVI